MATKSFLKSVNLNDKTLVASFVSAIENASEKSCKKVSVSRTYEDVKGAKLDKLLEDFAGDNQCQDTR